MTLPDFEALLLTRLALCLAEVSGIQKAFAYPPEKPVDDSETPFVYLLLGPMSNPTPIGAGHLEVTRLYVARLMVVPLRGASLDSTDAGARALAEVAPYLAKVRNHLADHPRLSTATLDDLAYLSQDVLLQDSGPVSRPGPGGTEYVAIDFNLTLAMRAKSTRFS